MGTYRERTGPDGQLSLFSLIDAESYLSNHHHLREVDLLINLQGKVIDPRR